jgi:hypothetical protein
MRKTKRRRLTDTYTFPGFRPLQTIIGLFGDPRARLIRLVRRGKKRSAVYVARRTGFGTTGVRGACETYLMATCESTWRSRFAE